MGNADHFTWSPSPGVEVRRAVLEDAISLAPRLRDADVVEVRALDGKDPLVALQEAVVCTDNSFALEVEGQVEAIFGVSGEIGVFGTIWLLGSDWLPANPRVLIKGMRIFLPILSAPFDFVGNLILEDQTVYRGFLKHFGFLFHREHAGPPNALLFAHPRFDHV